MEEDKTKKNITTTNEKIENESVESIDISGDSINSEEGANSFKVIFE